MKRIVVIAAHPRIEDSRVNLRLMQAVAALGPDHVDLRDLYTLYPDYLIDVAAEQAALAAADLVVWQQPLHWYGMTPLLKLWLDEVFAKGWAYGPDGHALQGKDLWLVVSTGSPADSYRPEGTHGQFFDAFMPPYEQTAALAGMRFLPPLVLHAAHRISDQAVEAHVQLYLQRLESYPDWPELAGLGACVPREVPAIDRPDNPDAAGAAPVR